MEWTDIASIVFVCVTMNHLGLIGTIEGMIGKRVPVINCPKCSTFWFTLTYSVIIGEEVAKMLAVSFLASYCSLWLELLEGYIDTLYMKLYGKIYETSDDTVASDPNGGDTADTVPEL